MKFRRIGGRQTFELTKEDVLEAKQVHGKVRDATWPYGRHTTCTMELWIKRRDGWGERFLKQSTYNGKANRKKGRPYVTRAALIQVPVGQQDPKKRMGHVEWDGTTRVFRCFIQDSRVFDGHWDGEEAVELAKHFEFL